MKARGTPLMALPNKDQLKFHSYKDVKLLMEAIKKRYGGNKESKNHNHKSKSSTNEADNTAYGVNAAHTQSNPTTGDNLSDAVICAFLASQPNSPQMSQEILQEDKLPNNQEKRKKENNRRTVIVETPNENALVAQDEVGGFSCNRMFWNIIPRKPDLTFIDEIVESENMDVTTIVTPSNVKTVESNLKSAGVKKFIPNVKDKTIRPSTEKIKFVNSARETVDKLLDERSGFAEVTRMITFYSVDLKTCSFPRKGFNIVLFAKATIDESNLWHRSLEAHKLFKNMNKFMRRNLVRVCEIKRIKREFSVARTPQQNGVAERRNRTLIEAVLRRMRLFNQRTRIVEETLNIRFLENTPNVTEIGPNWLFDVDSLSKSMNYVPVIAGNQTNGIVGKRDTIVASQAKKKIKPEQEYILIPLSTTDPLISQGPKDSEKDARMKPTEVDERNSPFRNAFTLLNIPNVTLMNDTRIFDGAYDDEVGAAADLNNLETTMNRGIASEKQGQDGGTRLYPEKKDIDYDEMDVKSSFLYGTIEEEVYVCQPPGFEDPHFPDKVYKVYVDDIIFGSTKKSLCDEFEGLMHKRFQMSSMGELTFFLGLQVQQKKDGIFISQDKYVVEILKKFDFATVKTASTPMEPNKALIKDEEADSVDVHLYRSMIGSLMYLTASRPDIMFAVCACARFQVTPKMSHLHAVKRIFRYLKGQPKLGLWYPRDSPFDLEAFSDSDYAGASLDRKSTTGGCQFLGKRLISWQCKKQTIVANSTTEVELIHVIKIHTDHNVADLLKKAFDVSRFNFLVASIVAPCAKIPYWEVQMLKLGFETASKHFNDPPLSRGYTLGSGEDSMQLMKLMELCIKLSDLVSQKKKEMLHILNTASIKHDEGSLTLNELTVFCTTLSKKVEDLQSDLKQTKLTYGAAYTKLIVRVKKLEHKVKSRQPRRRARVVISDTKEDLEDPSKHGRRIGRTSADTEILLDQEEPTELVEDLGSGEKGEKEISTASATPKKKSKKQLEQERLRHKEAIRLQEQINEEERQRISRDAEIAKQLQEEFNRARQEQKVVAKVDQAYDIDGDSEIEKEVMKRPGFDFQQKSIKKTMNKIKASGSSKKRSREDSDEDNVKKQKLEDDAEKEELKDNIDVVPIDDIAIDFLKISFGANEDDEIWEESTGHKLDMLEII
ncbi:putative ribonuclease H-like domain-containing protein [Tanacetum coccineum]